MRFLFWSSSILFLLLKLVLVQSFGTSFDWITPRDICFLSEIFGAECKNVLWVGSYHGLCVLLKQGRKFGVNFNLFSREYGIRLHAALGKWGLIEIIRSVRGVHDVNTCGFSPGESLGVVCVWSGVPCVNNSKRAHLVVYTATARSNKIFIPSSWQQQPFDNLRIDSYDIMFITPPAI